MLKIFITNLGMHNEGKLVGEWADLDDFESFDDLEESGILKRIGIGSPRNDGTVYEEWFVTDYDTDIPGLEFSEYPDIDKLIELESQWDYLGEDGKIAVRAYLQEVRKDLDYALTVAQQGEYRVYRDCLDIATVMKYWYEEHEILRDLPTKYEDLIDWNKVAKEYGRDVYQYGFQTFIEFYE